MSQDSDMAPATSYDDEEVVAVVEVDTAIQVSPVLFERDIKDFTPRSDEVIADPKSFVPAFVSVETSEMKPETESKVVSETNATVAKATIRKSAPQVVQPPNSSEAISPGKNEPPA